MKKLIFNATILNNKQTGLGVYTKNILFRLLKCGSIDTIICDVNDYTVNNIIGKVNCKVVPLELSKGRFSVFKRNYKFSKFIKNNYNKKDILVYSPTQHGLLGNEINQIVTIHDLMPLIYPKGRLHQYIYYKYLIPRYISKVDKIITVSENTKKDLVKFYNVNEDKVSVIYNGYDMNNRFTKEESKSYILNKYKFGEFFLMVGIHYSYKNLHSVIKAYSQIYKELNAKLIIVGNSNVSYGQYLISLVDKLGLNDHVIFLGYVSDEDKDRLYKASKAFIYPSVYEGFGLPILEAMYNETPVLCSNTSSLPEVASSAAILFNPLDECEIINAMRKINSDNEVARKCIYAGTENIKRFSWDKAAEEVNKVITESL